MNFQKQKIGILGGGQLGKMLIQAGSILGYDICIMEDTKDCPAGAIAPCLTIGKITDYQDVVNFGMDCDIITIEIENVNIEALKYLESQGKKVYPTSAAIATIKDKGLQKEFYAHHQLPTSPFFSFKNKEELIENLELGIFSIPFVYKSRTEGYDGKGVSIVRDWNDLARLADQPCIAEALVDIAHEIAIIVARGTSGQMVTFPPTEMYFHPTANLVEYLFSPANVDDATTKEADLLAKNIAEKLEIVGLLAVEFFITANGQVLINEVAPRPHNSGHHTIEACNASQYELHLRALTDLPLITPTLHHATVMVNVLGESGYEGPVVYQGLDECLKIDGVHPHLYGKKITKPFRKLGHVTIIDADLQEAIRKSHIVKSTFKAIS